MLYLFIFSVLSVICFLFCFSLDVLILFFSSVISYMFRFVFSFIWVMYYVVYCCFSICFVLWAFLFFVVYACWILIMSVTFLFCVSVCAYFPISPLPLYICFSLFAQGCPFFCTCVLCASNLILSVLSLFYYVFYSSFFICVSASFSDDVLELYLFRFCFSRHCFCMLYIVCSFLIFINVPISCFLLYVYVFFVC